MFLQEVILSAAHFSVVMLAVAECFYRGFLVFITVILTVFVNVFSMTSWDGT